VEDLIVQRVVRRFQAAARKRPLDPEKMTKLLLWVRKNPKLGKTLKELWPVFDYLQVGFTTDHGEYPWWVIKLKDFRESISKSTLPKEYLDRIFLVARSVSGRSKLGRALAKGYLPWTDWDRFDRIQSAEDA
jgi:hypothetical protein